MKRTPTRTRTEKRSDARRDDATRSGLLAEQSDQTTERSGARPLARRDDAKRSEVLAEQSDQTTRLPDVRDGLTATERIVLTTLHELQKENGGRHVSAMELYGRVVERVNLSQRALQSVLLRLSGR